MLLLGHHSKKKRVRERKRERERERERENEVNRIDTRIISLDMGKRIINIYKIKRRYNLGNLKFYIDFFDKNNSKGNIY